MQTKLIVNGVDFSPYLAAGGIRESEIVRRERSVVTLDGIEHRGGIRKRRLEVQLIELRDSAKVRLFSALSSPATVYYNGGADGETTRIYYVSEPVTEAKSVRGGNTYWSGAAFTLEEK